MLDPEMARLVFRPAMATRLQGTNLTTAIAAISPTISRDNTAGEAARHDKMLAYLGEKLQTSRGHRHCPGPHHLARPSGDNPVKDSHTGSTFRETYPAQRSKGHHDLVNSSVTSDPLYHPTEKKRKKERRQNFLSSSPINLPLGTLMGATPADGSFSTTLAADQASNRMYGSAWFPRQYPSTAGRLSSNKLPHPIPKSLSSVSDAAGLERPEPPYAHDPPQSSAPVSVHFQYSHPPCNTLYVGNLPIDTSEEELKSIFSLQRGYKRLCFRTKQNGPMCFVEFEDVSFATKALNNLYGQILHNSVKGGIRPSFSKNPLGVRSSAIADEMDDQVFLVGADGGVSLGGIIREQREETAG